MDNMTNPNRMGFAGFILRILGFGSMMGKRTSNHIPLGSHSHLSVQKAKGVYKVQKGRAEVRSLNYGTNTLKRQRTLNGRQNLKVMPELKAVKAIAQRITRYWS